MIATPTEIELKLSFGQMMRANTIEMETIATKKMVILPRATMCQWRKFLSD